MWSGSSSPGSRTTGSSKIGSSHLARHRPPILGATRRAAGSGRENAAGVAIDFEAEGLLEGTRGRGRARRGASCSRSSSTTGSRSRSCAARSHEDRLALLPVERFLEGGGRATPPARWPSSPGSTRAAAPPVRRALGLPGPIPTTQGHRGGRRGGEADRRRPRRRPPAGRADRDRRACSASRCRRSPRRATRSSARRCSSPGDTELEAARRYLTAAQARWLRCWARPSPTRSTSTSASRFATPRSAGASSPAAGAGSQEVTACFADLVGFTRLGRDARPRASSGASTARLGELGREVAEPPVRLVKMIGDAVMLVSPSNDALLEAALRLVEAADGGGRLPAAPRRARPRRGDHARRRLLRASGQPRQPDHRRSPTREACWRDEAVHDAAGEEASAGPSPASASSRGSTRRRQALPRPARAATTKTTAA